MSTKLCLATVTLALAAGWLGPARALPQEEPAEVRWTSLSSGSQKVWVALPADARAGDTLSGTVRSEDSEESEESADRGTSVVLIGPSGERIADAPVPSKQSGSLRGTVFTWELPDDLAGDGKLVLESADGERLDEVGYEWARSAASPDTAYRLPVQGQAGHPLPVLGSFDGRAETTELEAGGEPVEQLTESPRGAAFDTGREPGSRDVSLTEDGLRTEWTTYLIGVELTAEKLDLSRGEESRFTARFSGLRDLPQELFPVPWELINRDPETVTVLGMEGVSERGEISARQVDDDGTHSFTRTLRGIRRGDFNLTVTVPWLFDIETELVDLELQGADPLDSGPDDDPGDDPADDQADDPEADADDDQDDDDQEPPRCECDSLSFSAQATNRSQGRNPSRARLVVDLPFDESPDLEVDLDWRVGDWIDLDLTNFRIDCGCGPGGTTGTCIARRGSTDHSDAGVRVYPTRADVGPDNNTVLRGAAELADGYRLTLELTDRFQVDRPYHTLRVWAKCFPGDDACGGPPRTCARSLRLVFR